MLVLYRCPRLGYYYGTYNTWHVPHLPNTRVLASIARSCATRHEYHTIPDGVFGPRAPGYKWLALESRPVIP